MIPPRALLIPLLAVFILLALWQHAKSADLGRPRDVVYVRGQWVSCPDLRSKVSWVGIDFARSEAMRRGYSEPDINRVIRLCRLQ